MTKKLTYQVTIGSKQYTLGADSFADVLSQATRITHGVVSVDDMDFVKVRG